MADFILDEWLWADLANENGSDRQAETISLLYAIYEICDRIVLVRGSRFEEKTVAFWIHTDPNRRKFARFYQNAFRYNSSKTVLLEPDRLPALPEDLSKDIASDDHYLVQAQLAVSASAIVTTDEKLKAACHVHGIASKDRNEFVRNYLSAYRSRGTQ